MFMFSLMCKFILLLMTQTASGFHWVFLCYVETCCVSCSLEEDQMHWEITRCDASCEHSGGCGSTECVFLVFERMLSADAHAGAGLCLTSFVQSKISQTRRFLQLSAAGSCVGLNNVAWSVVPSMSGQEHKKKIASLRIMASLGAFVGTSVASVLRGQSSRGGK